MTYEPRPSMNPTGRSRTHRNHAVTAPKNDPKRRFPCWCGESLVPRYRMFTSCCANYLLRTAPYLLNLDLSTVVSTPASLRTLRRADSDEIVVTGNDWAPAEADASELDQQTEYWLETWVLVERQRRLFGPAPLEEDSDDDDEPGAGQGPLRVDAGTTAG